jgi:replicative DNA helicase
MGVSLTDHALRYAGLGLRIFPIAWHGHPTKTAGHPLVSEWPTKATSDPAQIRAWWAKWPDAGIGLACGDKLDENRYLFVLDVDEHDPAASGSEALDELETANGALPDTPTVHTAGGGRHLYFTAPHEITNARGRLPKGIDVRGAGGYVVLPPSTHKSGRRHEWDVEAELGEVRTAAAPGWLLDVLRTEEASPETRPVAPKTPSVWDELDDRPATLWAEATSWTELLTRDGWTFAGKAREGHEEWVRPGKTIREGISATVGYGSFDKLKVFSELAPLPPGSYSKLGYWAHTRHGGDFSAAAKSLAPLVMEKPKPAKETVFEPTEGDWETPTPIAAEHEPPTFPLDVFPEWIRAQIEQVADEMQVAADLPAMMALGALSTIAAGKIRVRVRGPWLEGVNLYLVVALPPGAGKSPVFKLMIEKPLGDWERELDEGGETERARIEMRRKILSKRIEKAISSGDETEAWQAQDELLTLPETKTPKLFVDDATVEKLAVVMKEQGGRIALVSTEGGVFGMMTGRYSDVSFLDPYLQAWSGDTIRVDRLTRDDVIVRDPTLTIAVTVQPTVIAELADRPELRGRGLTARFMFAYPVDTVGRRDIGRETTFDTRIDERYREWITDLARTLAGFTDPVELNLSREALDLFTAWRARHETELAEFRSLEHMREWITKAQSSVIRLAGLLHVAEREPLGQPISGELMGRAIAVGDYWEAHARRVHDLFDADEELRLARKLLDFIRDRVEPGGSFSVRDVTQWSRTGAFRKVELAVEPLSMLTERGWIRPDFEGPIVTKRGSPSPTFTFSPLGGERLKQAQAGSTVHGERSTTTESAEVEPMSLMSQEEEIRTPPPSRETKTKVEADLEAHEAQEAQLTETRKACPL